MESKDNKDISEIPMTEKLGDGTQYRFVRETIIDRKTKIKQGLIKTAINLLLIVGACIVTSFIFIHFIIEREDKREAGKKSDQSTSVIDATSKDSTDETVPNETTVKETPEEKAEKIILSSTIEFKGYSLERFTTFTGVVLSKNKDIIAITNASNLDGINNFGAKISDKKEVPAEVMIVDDELHIAYLKIKKDKLTEKEIKDITVSNIDVSSTVQMGDTVRYIGWGNKSGMILIDGKVVSQGATQLATDISYNKYMIDIMINEIKDGFVFDENGNLLAMGMLQSEDGGKVGVVDLTSLRADIYTAINNGYLIEFGIVSQQVSEEVKNLVGMDLPNGIFVTSVGENTPAYDGGIMVGDVIYKIDDTDINKYTDYRKYLNSKERGDTVVVYLYRRLGSRLNPYEIKVELGERK